MNPTLAPCFPAARRGPWPVVGRLAASFIAAGLALWIGERVYLRQPITTDENSYLFQAHTFSELRLRRPAPVPPEIYWRIMIIVDETTGWVSRYPPGHPLWLTPGVWLGDARWMVALAAGVSVWFLTGCAVMLGAPAWSTALFLLICPFFLFMHGTLLSHTSGMAAAAVMLWGYLRWRLRDRLDGAVVAGLAWGLFLLNRTYTAALVAVPFGLDALIALWRAPDRRQWLGAGLFAGCAALGPLLYLGYNHLITGSAFLTPYAYYNPNEGLGFGPRAWEENFTLAKAWFHLAANTQLLDRWLLLGGGALWLFGLLAALGWTRRWSPLALAGILVIPAGYFFFFCPGINTCGPFYYFETLPFFALLWMLAVRRLFDPARPALRRAATGIVLAGLIAAAVPSLRFMRSQARRISAWQAELARLDRVLHSAPPNSFVIVENISEEWTHRAVFNPRGLDSDPLLFVGLGDYNPLITEGLTQRAGFFLHPEHSDRLEPITRRPAFAHRVPWYKMPYQTGRPTGPGDAEGAGRRAVAPDDPPGFLAMGHYQTVPPGRYRAAFDLEATAAGAAAPSAAVEISAERGRRILARKEVGGSPGRAEIGLMFELTEFTEIEPRVYFGGGDVTFRGVAVTDAD